MSNLDQRLPATSTVRASTISNLLPLRSPEVFSPRFHDLSPRDLLDLMGQILFGASTIQASGVSNSYALVSPEVISPETHDLLMRVSPLI
jgi:hypothetical protein